jgi:hypothetical protein
MADCGVLLNCVYLECESCPSRANIQIAVFRGTYYTVTDRTISVSADYSPTEIHRKDCSEYPRDLCISPDDNRLGSKRVVYNKK